MEPDDPEQLRRHLEALIRVSEKHGDAEVLRAIDEARKALSAYDRYREAREQ